MTKLSLAFSPCPNDTFIFWAMTHGMVDTEGLEFEYFMEDVETLNRMAFAEGTDVIKVSYHAYLSLQKEYTLLEAGSALGFGNGPLLVSRNSYAPEDVPALTIAIPGEHTTANLLLKFAFPAIKARKVMLFSQVEAAVLSGEADAGVLIHETRFTYESKGLQKIMDLGEYWERRTHLPIPLGGIVARTRLGEQTIGRLNRALKRSVFYALDNPAEPMEFVRRYAQEMDEEVMRKHIALYVTRHTADLGPEGRAAVRRLQDLFLGS